MTALADYGDVPPDLQSFLVGQASLEAAWDACPRADWLLFLARHRTLDESQQRALVRAVARAVSVSGGRIRRSHRAKVADAWGSSDTELDDATGFRALTAGAIVGALVGIPVEIYVSLHPDIAGGALRGLRRELVTLPLFFVVFVIVRLTAKPLLARSWARSVNAYSFERAQRELFPLLAPAVANASEAERRIQVDLFRRQFVPATL